MNGVEQLESDIPYTPENKGHARSIQEHSETQLYTLSTQEVSNTKRWVSLAFWSMQRIWRVVGFLYFDGLWGYPFNPTYKTIHWRAIVTRAALSGSDNLLLLERFDFLCEGLNLFFERLVFYASPVC